MKNPQMTSKISREIRARLPFVTLALVGLVLGAGLLSGCGGGLCIGGIGDCGSSGDTTGTSTGTGSTSSASFQINAASWPRNQAGHVYISTATVSQLNLVITGGVQPYQNLGFYTTTGDQGTFPTGLTASTNAYTAVYQAPTTANPSVVIKVQDSSNPVQTAYLPLVIDAQ